MNVNMKRTLTNLNRIGALGSQVVFKHSAILAYCDVDVPQIHLGVSNGVLKSMSKLMSQNITIDPEDSFKGTLEAPYVIYTTIDKNECLYKDDLDIYFKDPVWVLPDLSLKQHTSSVFKNMAVTIMALEARKAVIDRLTRRRGYLYKNETIVGSKVDYSILKLILRTDTNEEIIIDPNKDPTF